MKVAIVAAVLLVVSLFPLANGFVMPASAELRPAAIMPAVATYVESEPVAAIPQTNLDSNPVPATMPAIVPVSPAPAASLADLVTQWDETPLDGEARCLAAAIFFESRSESLEGQLAVADVVLARARSNRFPTSICDVLTQKGQFSFVRAGQIPTVPTHRPAWRTAQAIAQIAMEGLWKNPAKGALFFHADYIEPNWHREEIRQIGRHIFYR